MNKETEYQDSILHKGKFISFVKRDSSKGPYEMIVRNNISGIVAIFPVTESWEALLLEEFRVPLWQRILSIPAGLCDAEGESMEDTARRELLEETGYAGGDMQFAFHSAASPGLSNESVACYVASWVKKVAEQSLQDEEDILVKLVPLDNLRAYLRAYESSGWLVDAKLRALMSAYEDIRWVRI